MNVFPTVHLAVFLNVFSTIFLAVFLYVFLTVFLAVFLAHIHNRHSAVTVASRSQAQARDLCNLRRTVTVPKASLSHCSASEGTQPIRRQIHSDQVCATEQWHPAATSSCKGAPWLRAEVPWQSWLVVDHEVTGKQRRPSDVELMRSLSNQQPLLRKSPSSLEGEQTMGWMS